MFFVFAFMAIHGISIWQKMGLKLRGTVGTQELVVTVKIKRK